MKNMIFTLIAVFAVSLTLTGCGGGSTSKVDDSKWTAQDKENAIKNCKFGRQKDDAAKVEKMCGCYLNKVIALSPNPAEQSKIPMAEVTKLNAECTKEAGL